MTDNLGVGNQLNEFFSETYEQQRHDRYHILVDELEVASIVGFVYDQIVLEAGCGTGIILFPVSTIAKEAHGTDSSDKKLSLARNKGLNVQQAPPDKLPYEDNYFDLVYSFKLLPYTENVTEVIKEFSRVTKPGGLLKLEFYNSRCIRYFLNKLKPGKKNQLNSGYIRYDDLKLIKSYLPEDLVIEKTEGLIIAGIFNFLYSVPVLSAVIKHIDNKLQHSKLACFGTYLIVTFRKTGQLEHKE
jgi:ubiquinone/menaquinone biosynthesis C-methylase UbiE